ncbi:MAG: aminotransferase class V-fold PLP-dependent enzyme [Synergistaceae bacterium]|jgi:cysteine desulfurase family protein|nr:aminotransferase class V-fold PLP-dependent enzyme [Synergistaceae bacterium]
MKQIYMNYAATSPRMSPAVTDALVGHLRQNVNLNAGRNFEGLDDSAIELRARRALAGLFNVADPNRVIFTSGITASLNMILNGLLKEGDHVLTSGVEHNAVARPLEMLRRKGVIEVDHLQCQADGTLDPESVHKAFLPNTRLVVLTHASNVLGTILPIRECFRIARERGALTVLDAAQTAGVFPFSMDDQNIDVLAFTGHKGLRGLAGTGGFVLSPSAAEQMAPWLSGGTGSASDNLEQPDFLPDKFEPGTHNILGILSLALSVEEILRLGVDVIRAREMTLTAKFLELCEGLPNLRVHGPKDAKRSAAIVSVDSPGGDVGVMAGRLYYEHGVITRSGLHCSPLAHKTAGTFPHGTLRFSLGYDTTEKELFDVAEALKKVL